MEKISRRDFIKGSAVALASVAAPTIINYLGESSPSSDKEFLEVRDGKFYMGGEEYTIKGTNYLTRDNPWKMFEDFEPEKIEKDLSYAEELGIKDLRVPLMTVYAQKNTESYFQNFNNFLDIAENHDMKVMPIALGHVPWKYFVSRNHDEIQNYLENWLPDFKDDERILAWDVKNEPAIHQKIMERNHGDKYKIESFTKKAAEIIKEIDKNHPITIGLSDTDIPGEEVEDVLIESLPEYINYEDFYSFHYYVPIKYFDGAVEEIKEKTDKPVVLQEFGLPTLGDKHHNEEKQKWYFEEVLEKLNREDLNGSIFWELNDHSREAIEKDNQYSPKHERIDHFGVLRTDFSKKPAAHVVEQYYNWIM